MDVSVALVTSSDVVLLVTPPKTAEMLVVPAATPLARPRVPAALEMVAAAVLLDDQVAWLVTSNVEPSENVAMAVYCSVVRRATVAPSGVMATEESVAEVTVSTEV